VTAGVISLALATVRHLAAAAAAGSGWPRDRLL